MKIETYTRERDCVDDAMDTFRNTGQAQLIFKKRRKYYCVQGELTQESIETFINPFGEIRHYSEASDVRRQYETDGYELRGWVNSNGCFKNN